MEQIIFKTENDAKRVLNLLKSCIVKYGKASIADYYDIVEVHVNFTDLVQGWFNLDRSKIERAKNGFVIVFPEINNFRE